MARSVSYEIYSFKNGDWMLDSVHDDKNMAIHQGRMLISSPHHMAIRVIEESYDDVSDQSVSKIVYKEQKGGAEEKPKKAPAQKSKAPARKAKPRRKKKKGKSMMVIILSIGGISLGLLALVGVLIAIS